MGKVEKQCQDCASSVTANCGQSVVDGVLRWYLSLRCDNCGAALEIDGEGNTPDEIRNALIADSGEWEVRTTGVRLHKAEFAKSIRSVLDLSPADALQLTQEHALLHRGTQAEANWLRETLCHNGIHPDAVEMKRA